MSDLTPKEAADYIDGKLKSVGDMLEPEAEQAYSTAVNYLRKIASGELVKAPIRCIDCEYSLPMDMKKYPDLTCHLCDGNLRVRVDMSCLCAKRPEKEDSHETD